MNHRIGSIVFGFLVGLAVAAWSYQWLTDPDKGAQRERQESVVQTSRHLLLEKLQLTDPQIVDPLAPQRKVGKVYVYPVANGWEVSGYYRRADNDRWHAYLMLIDGDNSLLSLKVQDNSEDLRLIAAEDPNVTLRP